MTAITFTVRAVARDTGARIAECTITDHDTDFDWVESQAAAWAARTGREADIETSVHDSRGAVVRWERAGIRVHA